jgi:uncharacterized membrane protein (UPF0127 family)
MKKILVTILLLAVLGTIGIVSYKKMANKNSQIKGAQIQYSSIIIKDKKVRAEIADNEATRMKGLSGREELGADEGMLFVFEKSDIYPFWMKEMKFAIDIIWIKDKKIVDIVKYAQPPTADGKTITYTPRAEADLVLEMMAGFCTENNVKIGDEIIIK